MNANELQEIIEHLQNAKYTGAYKAASMLRQQQQQLDKAIQVIETIANEYVELSNDKIKWQNGDHIRWCKEFLAQYKQK
jgi:hypothetical protein